MTTIAWESALGALTKVEHLGASESGLLSFCDSPGGGIFVENGRICWVAADGLQHRLRDLLRRRAEGREARVDELYERCRVERRPFGQTLVTEGVISSSELEVVLRRHSAESLLHLCRKVVPRRWASRGSRGYSADFTFRAVDVLADIVDLALPKAREEALAALAPFGSERLRSAAFLVDPVSELPIPVAAPRDSATVESLLSMGNWAASVVAASKELVTTPQFTLAATATGDTVSVWWDGPYLYVAACEDRAAIAEITARHMVRH